MQIPLAECSALFGRGYARLVLLAIMKLLGWYIANA
jgi:hypothetical protein